MLNGEAKPINNTFSTRKYQIVNRLPPFLKIERKRGNDSGREEWRDKGREVGGREGRREGRDRSQAMP